jgi:hypothetical protein
MGIGGQGDNRITIRIKTRAAMTVAAMVVTKA